MKSLRVLIRLDRLKSRRRAVRPTPGSAAAKAGKPKNQGLTFWKPPLKKIPEYNNVYTKAIVAAWKIQERGLTAMRNRNTLLRAEQSRAEQGLTAPFLRPAGRLKLNTTFVMDNRRILTG